MNCLEWIAATSDILLALAGLCTAGAAIFGLRTWRQELNAKVRFEAARSLIRAVYQVRDSLASCRGPLIRANEFPENYFLTSRSARSDEDELRAHYHVYANRFNPVVLALKDVDAHALEAEALWGRKIQAQVAELRKCVLAVNIAIDDYLGDKSTGGESFKDQPFRKEVMRDLKASPGDESNPLTLRIDAAVRALEDELRPHLRHE